MALTTDMLRTISRAFFLAAFAAVSFLGHGGLHLLPGGDACHGRHHAVAESHAEHTHAHGHACSHSHHHDATDPEPADHPAPADHDHQDCLVCQWHAQGQINVVGIVVPQGEDCGFDLAQRSAQVTTSFRLTTRFTRGPPLLGRPLTVSGSTAPERVRSGVC